jgi:MEMO1 family protein
VTVRPAAVAGLFYARSADELERTVRGHLAAVPAGPGNVPKAMILPHAGHLYSGSVAATGYRRLADAGGGIERVVLIGPSHRVRLGGVATVSADWFETPLGRVPVDPDARALPGVTVNDAAHADEHSLEVHLPFLQVALRGWRLVPLVVGNAEPTEVAAVLEAAWGGSETVVIVSSDLSHHHSYDEAVSRDRTTAAAIEALELERVSPQDACGCRAIGGLLEVARRRGLAVRLLDLRNSGDTAGPRDRVVGYGAFSVSGA